VVYVSFRVIEIACFVDAVGFAGSLCPDMSVGHLKTANGRSPSMYLRITAIL
jgi:hypothetical protein